MSENDEKLSQVIEIEDEQGNITKAELIDIVEMENKEYAILYPLDEENKPEDEQEAIVMRLIEENDCDYFEKIEDDEEFEKISNYIQELQEAN